MTGYTSKLRSLYRNVFLAILFFMAAVFAIIFFLMKPKVKIDFLTGSEFTKPISSVYYDRGEFLTEEILDAYNGSIGIHERPGYIFEGWNYNGMLIDLDTRFLLDTQLSASWVAKKYEVEFDLNGGEYNPELDLGDNNGFENINEIIISYRQENNLPKIPTPSGFVKDRIPGTEGQVANKDLYTKELVGWRVELSGKVYNNDETKNYVLVLNDVVGNNNHHLPEELENTLSFSEKVAYYKELVYGKVTLKAEWKHKEIKIIVLGDGEDEEGQTLPEFEYVSINHKMGESVQQNMLNQISRVGYNLEGLYYNQSLTQRVDFDTFAPYENTTIYAKWEEGNYNVMFDALNGGEEPGISNIYPLPDSVIKLQFGEILERPVETPQLSGYEFMGWYLGYDFGTKTYGVAFDFENDRIGSDTTLYAKWEEDRLIDRWDEYNHSQYYKYEPFSYIEDGETISGYKIVGFKTMADGDDGGYAYVGEGYLSEPVLIVPSRHPVNSQPVLAIDAHVFNNLNSLTTEVRIASSIKEIHPQAFWLLPKLEKILVDTNNTNYDDDNRAGVLYNKDRTVLIKYPAGKEEDSYIVGEEGRNVKEIYPYAFYGNQHLKNITLNVEKIGGGAFQNTKLENVVITSAVKFAEFGLDESGKYISVFRNAAGAISIKNIDTSQSSQFVFEDGALYGGGANKYHTLFNYFVNSEYGVSTTYLGVNDKTEIIKDHAFENSNLKTLLLPNVGEIGVGAFRFSMQLEIVSFEDNSKNISFGENEGLLHRHVFFNANVENLTLVATNEAFRSRLEQAQMAGQFTGFPSSDEKITIVPGL